MAIREIREDGDEILRKKSKEIKEVTPKIKELIRDMYETMEYSQGVGLAAVQVGILKRLFVIDIGEGPHTFINPEIIETSGEQTGYEGCLSIPGKAGIVTRPNYVKVKAFDENMEEFVLEGEELMARAILHENAHLDGQLFKDIVEGELIDSSELDEENEE